MKKTTRRPTESAKRPTGIRRGEILPTEQFCEDMGWGRKAFVAARRAGLPTFKRSRRLYIDTDAAIDWLRSQGAAK